MNLKPRGFVSIVSAKDSSGNEIQTSELIKNGWVNPGKAGKWDLRDGEIPLNSNLFVDNGRQLLTYLFGGRSPLGSYSCQSFGVGTDSTPAAVTNTALGSPYAFSAGVYTKAIDSVTFTTPFVADVGFTLGAGDANGYLLREFGLFSGNGALLARMVSQGVNKTSDWSPVYSWRIRF